MTDNERLTVTVEQASRLLGISRASGYQGVLSGEIPHIRVGKRILVPRGALERMLNGAAAVPGAGQKTD